jgi:hypothetical protein
MTCYEICWRLDLVVQFVLVSNIFPLSTVFERFMDLLVLLWRLLTVVENSCLPLNWWLDFRTCFVVCVVRFRPFTLTTSSGDDSPGENYINLAEALNG